MTAAAPQPVVAHRRQFVLGPAPTAAAEDWITQPLPGTGMLSHCPALRRIHARDAEGVAWALLGLAVETRADRAADLGALIGATATADVPDLTSSWAGRWVLMGAGGVHPDAASLLGIFHGRDPHGSVWLSSSPVLAARQLRIDPRAAADTRRLAYEQGISWYTPPLSRFAGVSQLLPSAWLEVATGTPRPRRLLPPVAEQGEDAIAALADALTTTLRRLPQQDGAPPWLGLTAGYDSRLILAIAAAAGVPVRPYTRVSARMSVADRVLPPQLARAAGYGHTLVHAPAEPEPAARAALITEHSGGSVSDGDAEHLRRGVRDGMTGLSFGGHGFSAFSGFGWTTGLPPSVGSAADGASRLVAAFGEPAGGSAERGLRAWLDWAIGSAPEPEGMDWRDRFFLEQRMAGWLAAKEQLYDAGTLERFPILNAARTYALGLRGLPEQARRGGRLQAELTRRLCPALADFPWNPPGRYFLRTHPLRVVSRGLRRLRRRLAAG